MCILEEPVPAHYFKVFTYLKENQRQKTVYHKLRLIHVNVWQNQYSIVKQNKVKIKILKIKKKKSRDTALPTKVHLAKAMVFPVVIYGCESWTIKKAEG